jgi:hypothetical protein
MAIELGDGAVVRVAPPALPTVTVAPPGPETVHVLPVVGAPGPQGVPGPPGDVAGQLRATATASTALSGHRVVTALADGTLGYADNTDPDHVYVPMWLTLGAIEAGAEGDVLVYGLVDEPSWAWAPGPLYLGTDGQLTQTAPAAPALFLAQVGVATRPTTAFIDRQPSITLTP